MVNIDTIFLFSSVYTFLIDVFSGLLKAYLFAWANGYKTSPDYVTCRIAYEWLSIQPAGFFNCQNLASLRWSSLADLIVELALSRPRIISPSVPLSLLHNMYILPGDY